MLSAFLRRAMCILGEETKISAAIDMKNLPKDLKGAKIVDVAVGFDHAFVLDDNGKLYGWGSDRTQSAPCFR
jgi:peptide/nickel transport system permease protein